MKKVPGHPRLHVRGTTYYHRAAIPKDIKDTYPKVEEKKSLRTSDFAEAIRRVRVEAAIVDRAFEEHRRKLAQTASRDSRAAQVEELTPEQLDLAEQLYYTHLLEEDEETRLDGFFDPDEETPQLPLPAFDEHSESNDELSGHTRKVYAQGKVDDFFKAEAEEVLSWQGLDVTLAEGSPSWKRLARRLQEATIKAREQIKARNQGEIVPTPASPEPSFAGRGSGTFASEAMAEWIQEKSLGAWRPKTQREHKVWSTHFLDVVGDKDVTSYAKADARKFKAVLRNLPPNWVKNSQIRHLPISEASSRAAELGLKPMTNKNINKLMNFVGSFWRWAEGNYDDVNGDLFKGLQLPVDTDAAEERDPFSSEDLQRILNAPLFTGCRSISRYRQVGSYIPRNRGYYWLPLIGLFSGMRLNEILQLECRDVAEFDDVLCFDNNLSAPDKSLKNKASKRKVPVHSELIKLGFLSFVDQQRGLGCRRIFEDLKVGNDEYYSSPFSKWFGRFLSSAGAKSEKTSYHSFRHNFRDACRAADVPDSVANALIGHTERGMAARYGKGYTPSDLKRWMEKISYPDLDLTHLLPKA
ncbi:MAG: site-specific integrase [Roseibium sp.]|uniref:site-specific integrase n=1 Tax=Roseibium sp. TaxID=1936156 RepID=UPI00262560F1|nr:site-specific integrase [Roseibium sp.]MCV0429901.1 site-specific integrase [Roseibium sp.]